MLSDYALLSVPERVMMMMIVIVMLLMILVKMIIFMRKRAGQVGERSSAKTFPKT